MTDHDRGAYTPQADAPLAFDARGPRDSRPIPMTLVASGVVLLVILGALFLAYRGGVRGGAETIRPVGEPVGAIKTAAAPNTTQPQDPAANLDVYAAQNVPNAKPAFAPAPEQPAPRPAPTQLHVQSVAAPPVRIEPSETTVAAAKPGRTSIKPGAADQARPASAAASRPVQTAALTSAPTPAPATATLRPAAATPAPAKPVAAKPAASGTAVSIAAGGASASSGSAVQIGAFSSKALADRGYADVSGLMAGAMGGKSQHVEPVAHGDKTVFRTTIGGFADHAAAKAFCASLSAKGHTCFVKG